MSKLDSKERAHQVYEILKSQHPNVGTFLSHETPFQLLVAVILSAQCTDARVNQVTPTLFKAFPDVKSVATADLEKLKEPIRSISFFNAKAQNIQKTAQLLLQDFGGQVPSTLEELILLPGVGRKTANVILGQVFDKPGITVDTHVKRLSLRLGFSKEKTPEKIESDLMKLWRKETWSYFSTILILHGRLVCDARKPKCSICKLQELCPKIAVLRPQ